MFVTQHDISQHVSDSTGAMLISMGAKVSTAREAAECVSRLIALGASAMKEANEDFNRIYRLSAAETVMPVPNPAGDGPRVSAIMRGFEHSETFAHLFDEEGEVL